MPSIDVGVEVLKNRARNCCPCVRSLVHSPDAVIHSPAEIEAAWPTTVTRSRCPRALVRRTQNPFSSLCKVTRSTRPTSTSCGDAFDSGNIRAMTDSRAVCASDSLRDTCGPFDAARKASDLQDASMCGETGGNQLL